MRFAFYGRVSTAEFQDRASSRHLVPVLAVAVDHGPDGICELGATVPAGEQVDVLAESLDDAVLLDGVPAREGEPEPRGGLQPDQCQTAMRGVHQPGVNPERGVRRPENCCGQIADGKTPNLPGAIEDASVLGVLTPILWHTT